MHRPIQPDRTHPFAPQALPLLAALTPTLTSWAQPPAQPEKEEEAPKPQTFFHGGGMFGGGGMRAFTGDDGKMVVETLDANGKVIKRQEVTPGENGGCALVPGVPQPPTQPRTPKKRGVPTVQRTEGALAVSEKFVFVLLGGVLYQYDLETLKLKAHVKVAPPGKQAAAHEAAAAPAAGFFAPMMEFFGGAAPQPDAAQ